MPVEVAALVGEALVRQSSGRHRVAPSAVVAVATHETLGVTVEVAASYLHDEAEGRALSTWSARPAALATATLGHEPGWVRAGLGPALVVTAATWTEPALGTVTLLEPGVRAELAVGRSFGKALDARLSFGAGWRPSGTDYDAMLGVAWHASSR